MLIGNKPWRISIYTQSKLFKSRVDGISIYTQSKLFKSRVDG